ncbi:MAG: cation transporter [Chloroflexi bacterium]|nr:MAG: cation transporter [Chloroflexota bacterium]
METRHGLIRFAWLSIGTAVLTISLKVAAYALTGSVGLLSDALESGVNLVTAVFSLIVLSIATRPPDDDHPHGHGKAEYFSSGLEGLLILVAAGGIGITAVRSFIHPQPLEQLGIGLLISIVAALCNLITATILRRAGKRHDSITLTASSHHLLSDVYTSFGIAIGVGAVALIGWQWLDGTLALIVAAHILRTGLNLVYDSSQGLMDRTLPNEEHQQIVNILDEFKAQQVQYHALRTRRSGNQRFISVHIQVPGAWSVQQGHELLEDIERNMRQTIPPVHILTHLEPLEDPASWEDLTLNRVDGNGR